MTWHTDYRFIFIFYGVHMAFMIFLLKMRNNEKYSEKLIKMKKKSGKIKNNEFFFWKN